MEIYEDLQFAFEQEKLARHLSDAELACQWRVYIVDLLMEIDDSQAAKKAAREFLSPVRVEYSRW